MEKSCTHTTKCKSKTMVLMEQKILFMYTKSAIIICTVENVLGSRRLEPDDRKTITSGS